MAKRKVVSKGKKKNNYEKEVYGIVLLALSLLIGISIYVHPTGYFGRIFRDFFAGLLGAGAYIFPILLFLVSGALIINKGQIKVQSKFIYFWLILYNILLILHINISYKVKGMSFMQRLSNSYNVGLNLKGGGIISEIVDIPLIYIFGKIGTYIVLICISIIFIIMMTEVSIGTIINKIIDNLKSNINIFMEKRNEKAKNKKIIKEVAIKDSIIEEKDDKNAYEENIEKLDKKIKILDFLKTDIDNISDGENIANVEQNTVEKASTNSNTDKEDEKIHIDISNTENENIVYQFPPLDLLLENKVKVNTQDKKELLSNARLLEQTLQSFGVDAKVVQVSRGPAVTRYELHPGSGVKVSKIVNLADDIALNLAAPTVRIEAPIPGKAAVGIEIPNKEVVMVTLREGIDSKEFSDFNSKVAFFMGKDISGKCIVTDLSKMPHLLIAGATGSGKSVCINTLITSLIYKSSPQEVKMLLIDPKVVELSVYNGIPHLLIPVVTDAKKAASALFWAVNEMTQRYKRFADSNVRNIESYNKLVEETNEGSKMPQIVIIIDELADLMMVAQNDVEDAVCRLAQMARAAGMHLVIATQRPSVDVITGIIKANIPSRISFAVSSQIDSRTILDMSGAEKLLGKGDMLFLPIGDVKPIRIQGAFVSEKEVENIVDYVKKSSATNYNESIINEIEKESVQTSSDDASDELLPEAIKLTVECGQISASMLQRRLRVGFNRAARLVEDMEARGIVGPQDGSKPRQALMSKEEFGDNF